MNVFVQNKFTLIIRICSFLIFFGRGWQHIFWDAPYRTFFWSEGLLSPFVEGFTSMSWQSYATSPTVDDFIQGLIVSLGIFYFVLAFLSLFISHKMKKLGISLLIGSSSLAILSLLYFAEKFFYIGMLIEHAIQVGVPVVLYIALFKDHFFDKYLLFFKALISLTFIGHGMFAFGIHPTPGPFIDMIINVFGTTETNALYLLKIAGSLDFLVGILIFIPEVALGALAFNIFWGIATAFARSLAHIDGDLFAMTSHQWIHETIFRLPHGLFPFAIFYVLWKQKSTTN